MATLSDLIAAGDSSVIPGHTICPFPLRAFGEAQDEFARWLLNRAGRACEGLPPSIQTKLLDAAASKVASGEFVYGRPGFAAQAKALSNLPFMLYLALRPAHPQITPAVAESLITTENETLVWRAVMKAIGFASQTEGDPSKKTQTAGGTGPASSLPSAVVASPIETSPT